MERRGRIQDQLTYEPELLARWERSSSDDVTEFRSIAEAISATLTEAIVDRVLPPATRLSEERLAKLFQVSRTPIREALATLANSDLAHRDGRGSLRVNSVTSDQILEVYSVRVGLEGIAAALAAESASAKAISQLRDINRRSKDAAEADDFDLLARLNLDFHRAITAAADNALLARFVDEIHTWLRRIPTTTLSYPGRARVALAEHESIIDAISARDRTRAEELARVHMRQAEAIRLKMYETD